MGVRSDSGVDAAARFREWGQTRYHTPQDDLGQPMDLNAGARHAQLNFLAGLEIANADERPAWKPGDFFGRMFGGSRGLTQGTPADSQAILSLIQAHATAWNRRDAKAAAAIMTPDAVWITSSGTRLRGRAEIERAHLQWLAEDSAAGGSRHSHPTETITIRFLRADVAVADVGSHYVPVPRSGKQVPAPKPTYLFVALTRDAGQWHIAQVRNTISPRPGP
jgi:uncharacterized protein (TIGR02246 family)